METNGIGSQNRSPRYVRSIAVLSLGLSLLSGCSFASNNLSGSGESQDSLLYNSEQSLDLNFPQPTCGESSSEPRETWYVVYIDRANPDEVRRQYCNDAIGTVRRETGVPTVQVASFTDYSRALRFAAAVEGEVEVMTGEQAAAGATDERARQARDAEAGIAYLTSSEPGSLINIRERATTSSPIKQTGRTGDQIQIADQTQGEDGQTWYKITLNSSDEGWVRSDFVTQNRSGESERFTSNVQPGVIQPGSDSTIRPSSSPGAGTDRPNPYGSTSTDSPNPYASSTGDRSGTSSSGTSSSTSSYSPDQSREASYADRTSTDADYTTSEQSSHDGSVLTANDPGAVINVRDDASTTASVRHTGYAGDPIHIADVTQGEDGYTWYYVEFSSGVAGWVRGDFVD
ncbi:SH3 domain-containing protein [Egbenema bharatensis]|uniref:SH3 domain-containing protein n=1 Tax=Egbenema bharatensis TaxID=3463334 RepID=UPI003A8C4008